MMFFGVIFFAMLSALLAFRVLTSRLFWRVVGVMFFIVLFLAVYQSIR